MAQKYLYSNLAIFPDRTKLKLDLNIQRLVCMDITLYDKKKCRNLNRKIFLILR